jgi:glycerol uptake facilitator-like aquaporin
MTMVSGDERIEHVGGRHPRIGAAASRLIAEAIGTAALLCVVIGSGIMAERLAAGNAALALLGNTVATVGALYVLIELFAPVSGAHFNPVVSLCMATRGAFPKRWVAPYIAAQLVGAALGAWLAHAMFDMPILEVSTHVRSSPGQWLGEVVATIGLLLIVLRAPEARVAAMVAAFIGAGYWFTSSTAFANPAATLGRMLTDSFAGIAPSSVAPFVVAEMIGGAIALAIDAMLGRTT